MTQRRFFRSIGSIGNLGTGRLRAANPVAILPVAGLIASIALTGCRDSDVQSRVNATTEIVTQTRAGAKAAEAITSENREARADELESLASKTAQIGGTNDQKAAAGLLSAEMATTAASLLTAHLRDLEMEASQQRALIAAAADAAASLESVAEADSKLSLGSDREFIMRAREGAETALKALQSKIKELETPIGDLRKNLETRRASLLELQKRADQLRRQANDAGASAGFQYVEQSADVKTNAAQLRATIAGDELNLFELEPELSRANTALTGAQSVVSAADTATQALENFSTELTTNARKLDEAAEALRAATQTALDGLNAQIEGPMTTTFDKASALLESAARNAARGGGGREISEAGTQAKLDAEISLATLSAHRVTSLNAQITLLGQLAGAGSLFGGDAKQKPAIDALTTQRNEVLALTKDRFTALLETLNGMDAEKPTVARTKASVEAMVAQLEGKAIAATSGAASSGSSSPATTSASPPKDIVPIGKGFASQQELVDAFVSNPNDLGGMLAATRTGFAFGSQANATLLNSILSMADAVLPLIDAIDAKFGEGSGMKLLSESGSQLGSAGGDSYEFVERDGKPFLMATSSEGVAELPIVSTNGRFFAFADPLFDRLDPQERSMMTAMAPMMSQMKSQISLQLKPLIDAINRGDVKSLDELRAAFQAAASMQGGNDE